MSEERKINTLDKSLTGKASIDKPWEKYYTSVVNNGQIPKLSVYDYIYQNNHKYPLRTAINYFGRKISYGELFANIEQTAKAFKHMNIEKGDIVTLCMPTTPETIYIFYALSKIGAISNMIDPRTNKEGIKNYLNEAESTILITLDLFNQKVNSLIKETKVKDIVNISASDSLPMGLNIAFNTISTAKKILGKDTKVTKNDQNMNWQEFLEEAKYYSGTLEDVYEENMAVSIVHTGGTTGFPKGVLLSNDNFNAIAYQYKNSGMHLLPGHKFLDIMPPFIAYGLGCGIHMPLVVGMTTVLIPSFNPKDFAKYISKYEPNHLAGVPSHWENLLENKLLTKKDLSFLISPAVGGDAMDISLEKAASKFLKERNAPNDIIKGYGITEECSLASACINDINEVGSVGIPLPHNTIAIFEPDTENELSYKEHGEICIAGPTVMIGYYNNQEETDKIIKKHSDGISWIHTQDIGYMTEDGFLYVDGRIKRIIIRHDGFKVFPFIIENVIKQHPAVKNCMVVSTPDVNHTQGFLPKAQVILNEEYILMQEIIKEEIIKFCNEKLPEYAIPSEYNFRQDFPITPIGKVDFKAMEEEDAYRLLEQQAILSLSK